MPEENENEAIPYEGDDVEREAPVRPEDMPKRGQRTPPENAENDVHGGGETTENPEYRHARAEGEVPSGREELDE